MYSCANCQVGGNNTLNDEEKTRKTSDAQKLQSPQPNTPRTRLFCNKCDSSGSGDETVVKKSKKSDNHLEQVKDFNVSLKKSISEPDLSSDEIQRPCNSYMTSTPACVPRYACSEAIFTPEDHERRSMSPITRSTQRMPRAMQVLGGIWWLEKSSFGCFRGRIL